MPRKPNPHLETIILASALDLLDQEGMEAVTMREVARRAKTTTPTLYERFQDREALLWAVVTLVQAHVYGCVAEAASVEQMAAIIIDYLAGFPGRLDLVNQYWPKLMSSGHPKPVLELTKRKLMEDEKCTAAAAEKTAIALTALLLGTAVLMRTAGENTPESKALNASSLRAVRSICHGT